MTSEDPKAVESRSEHIRAKVHRLNPRAGARDKSAAEKAAAQQESAMSEDDDPGPSAA